MTKALTPNWLLPMTDANWQPQPSPSIPKEHHGRHDGNDFMQPPKVSTTKQIAKALLLAGAVDAVIGHNSGQKKDKGVSVDCNGSSCFDRLKYKDGTVYATFTDGTEFAYDVDKETAQEWFASDSLGGYFNKEIR